MKELKKDPNFNYKELASISFGELEGEDDEDILSSSLILTNSISSLLKKEYNYVLSPKGAGKSAIFNAYKSKLFSEEYIDYDVNNYICINDAFGFDSEYLNPLRFKHNLENKNYTFAWGLYLISKLIKDIDTNFNHFSNYSSFINKIKRIEDFKEDFDLTNIWDILEHLNLQCDFVVNGQQFKVAPKIGSKNKRKRINLNEIFGLINDFYKENNKKTFILIDRVDNFVGQQEYKEQKKYVQGLVSAIEEIRRETNIKPILFLRTDLYHSLNIQFEYDKAKARTIHLKWTKTEILIFVVRRFLSNKYISDNYESILFSSFVNELDNNTFFLKRIWKKFFKDKTNYNKVDLEKNTDYRIIENFLKAFFPSKIMHLNNKSLEEEIDLFDWLYSHFIDKNDYINPRCLIYFLNKLAINQYEAYENDIKLSNSEFYCKCTSSNPIAFNVFIPEVILKTYREVCNDELIGIHSLISPLEQKIFKKINELSYNNGTFSFGSINYSKFGIDKTGFERLLKYLEIIGFCREVGSKNYSISIIFRTKLAI